MRSRSSVTLATHSIQMVTIQRIQMIRLQILRRRFTQLTLTCQYRSTWLIGVFTHMILRINKHTIKS